MWEIGCLHMKDKRILEILKCWITDYPSLVVTILWRIEIHLIQNGDLEASNHIMRIRAWVYTSLIKKYKAEDPDGIKVFYQEYFYCIRTSRHKSPAKEIERIEIKSDESIDIEKYEQESYTHINDYNIEHLSGIKSLFDIKFANKKYDETENRNILDILEILAYDEEKQALNAENINFYSRYSHFRYHKEALGFRSIKGYDEKQHLCPFRTAYGRYYRGQNAYYAPCLSSIDRNLTDANIFVERLKETTIKHLFQHHPTTTHFNERTEFELANGKKTSSIYYIDFLALAQHYGVYTNLLDITSDKMIAAFFACTEYNCQEDKYYAYTKQGKGVFYVYRDKNIFSKDSRISCVGLQPLSRPGAQAGYVLAMNKKEDFNNLCSEAITFTHDQTIAKQIYELVNLLGEPFVNDVMSNRAKNIVRGNSFNKDILEKTIQSFYPTIGTDTINGWIRESEINITEDPLVTFTEQEIEALNNETLAAVNQLKTDVFHKELICKRFV